MKSVYKYLLFSALILCTSLMWAPESAKAQGGDTPFPWGSEIQVNWETLNGVWYIEGDRGRSYFSIEVETLMDASGVPGSLVHTIQVTQYDPNTHHVLASGVGVAVEYQRIGALFMQTPNASRYVLVMRAYEGATGKPDDTVPVLTMRALDTANAQGFSFHFVMKRLSYEPIYFGR